MTTTYRAVLIGCSRMGAFIDNEVPETRQPYSHAAGYEACDRTDLVACSDVRSEVMEQTGLRYGIPKDRQYPDYREMIEKEKPDIVSVATQPEQRADIVIYAAEHGAKAIYAEKAMAASLEEADAMVEAVKRNRVFFNMGTNRRWDPGYDTMIAVIESGRLGKLKSIVSHQTGALFNTASHIFDLLLRLNGDGPVQWAQAHLPDGDEIIDGDVLHEDPVAHGMFQFENGVMAYALNSGRGLEIEAVCEQGVVTALSNDTAWQIREPGGTDHRGRRILVSGAFPAFERSSSTLNLIQDLVHALDTGEPVRGGVQLARINMELIFTFIESHLRDGARVNLPLVHRSRTLQRRRDPRQPKYQRD